MNHHELLKNHCDSVGKDKNGITNCKNCPSAIRSDCYENGNPVPQGWDAMTQHANRIAALITTHKLNKNG